MNRFLLVATLPLLLGQVSPPPSWRSFAPKDNSFTVAVPGAPHEKKQQVKTESGPADVTLFVWQGPAETTFVVSVTDYPEAAVQGAEDKRLKNARDGAVENSKGKLIHERKITLTGIPGRELWIGTDMDGMIRARFYAVKQRLYQTMALGPKTAVETKEVAAFLDSFKLKK